MRLHLNRTEGDPRGKSCFGRVPLHSTPPPSMSNAVSFCKPPLPGWCARGRAAGSVARRGGRARLGTCSGGRGSLGRRWRAAPAAGGVRRGQASGGGVAECLHEGRGRGGSELLRRSRGNISSPLVYLCVVYVCVCLVSWSSNLSIYKYRGVALLDFVGSSDRSIDRSRPTLLVSLLGAACGPSREEIVLAVRFVPHHGRYVCSPENRFSVASGPCLTKSTCRKYLTKLLLRGEATELVHVRVNFLLDGCRDCRISRLIQVALAPLVALSTRYGAHRMLGCDGWHTQKAIIFPSRCPGYQISYSRSQRE